MTEIEELQTQVNYLTVHSRQQCEVIDELKEFVRENPPNLTSQQIADLKNVQLYQNHIKNYEIMMQKQVDQIEQLQTKLQ